MPANMVSFLEMLSPRCSSCSIPVYETGIAYAHLAWDLGVELGGRLDGQLFVQVNFF